MSIRKEKKLVSCIRLRCGIRNYKKERGYPFAKRMSFIIEQIPVLQFLRLDFVR